MKKLKDSGLIYGACFFAAAILTRIGFRSRWLYSWDSANFALGLLRFSPRDHQPHPPGYPLYIVVGRVVNHFLSDPNESLVLISIFCGAIAVAGIYFAGDRIFDRRTGVIAAWLLLFSPLVWFQSEVALSYIVELPFVVVLSWLLYELFWHRRFAIITAVVIGVAGGFRQDVFFLLPFFFIGTMRLKDRRHILFSWVTLALFILIWFLPFLYFSGGLSAYRDISSIQFQGAVTKNAFWNAGITGVIGNLLDIWRALLWLFGFSSLGILVIWLQAIKGESKRIDRRLLLLLALPMPAFVFFAATNFAQPGYSLVAVPFILILARSLAVVSGEINFKFFKLKSASLVLTFLLICAVFNSLMFLKIDKFDWVLPTTGATIRSDYESVSLSGIETVDNNLTAWIQTIEKSDPDSTLVISTSPMDYGFFGSYSRQLVFYLRDYRVLWLQLDSDQPPHQFQNQFEIFSSNKNEHDISIPAQITKIFFVGASPQEINKYLRPKLVLVNVIGGAPLTSSEMPPQGSFEIGPYIIHK
ncbi:MAG: glycosyltransferase family 39 protein [Thermoleophilia bacterium]|jgi:hypothetical protein